MRAHFAQIDDDRPVLDLRKEAKAHLPDLTGLPELSDDERAMAARTWRGRMVNEHVSAQVFAGLVPQAMAAALPGHLQAQLPKAIADEYRHAEQCAAVVMALGHEAVAPLPPIQPLPVHEDVGPLEGFLRNCLSVGCLSETIAVSIIRAEHAEMEGTPLGELLGSILADEVQHARLGWTVLGLLAPRLDDAARERMSEYLEDAFLHQLQYEIPKLPVNSGLRPELGLAGVCDGGAARALFFDTFAVVIVPKLEEVGFKAELAWERAQERFQAGH
jgi:hypothetical protein